MEFQSGHSEPVRVDQSLRRGVGRVLAGQALNAADVFAGRQPDEVLAALQAEGVAPLVYDASCAGSLIGLGEEISRGLQTGRQLAAARQLLLDEGLRHGLGVLRANGLDPVLIKGTALAYTLYPSPDLRPRADCDVLLDPASLEIAKNAFLNQGYSVAPRCLGRFLTHQFNATRVDRFGLAHAFDVHRRVNNSVLVSSTLPVATVRGKSEPLMALGERVTVPALEHALAIACLHLAAGREYPRLIWLYDIHLLAKALKDAGVEAFWAWARRERVVRLCRHYIRMMLDLIPLELDATLWRDLFVDEKTLPPEPSAVLLDHQVSYWRLRWLDVSSLETGSDRLRYVAEFMLPPVAYMRERYSLESAGVFDLIWAYGRRLLRGD